MMRRCLLATVPALLALAACGGGGEGGSGSGGNGEEAATRTVEHAEGTSEVPEEPERVVAVDLFAIDTLEALGVEPVGVRDPGTVPQYLRERVEGIESTGGAEPNLETLAAMEPDLILTLEGSETYDEMSQIAPTVAPAFESSAQWKEVHMKYAEALGMEEEGQQVLDDYDADMEEFQSEMGGELEETEVSILRVSAGGYSLYLPDSFPGTVVEDTGLPRPEGQRGTGFTEEISRELIDEADADHVFVWIFGADPGLAEEEQAELEDLQDDPLWQSLGAVERGAVTVEGDHWIGSGPLAAEMVLEDVSEALLDNG